MLLKNLKIQSSGNISFLVLTVLAVFSILFVFIFDLCQIFAVREETKKASDAASLAVAQNLLFFESQDCLKMAEEIARLNNCTLVECSCDYDEVIITVEKRIGFSLLNKFIKENGVVRSTSRAKVVYPWDEQFGYCDSYRFDY